jgi:hypothetical protein
MAREGFNQESMTLSTGHFRNPCGEQLEFGLQG